MSKMQRKPPRPPMQLTCDACGKTLEADRYKQERLKDMTRCASTRGCMRTLHDANRAKREGRQHY